MAMHTWFECKVRYEKVADNGLRKKVTESYVVNALSFTEAEARIIEEMIPFMSGEFTVADIKRANYSEIFPCDDFAADRWFKCKVLFITLDAKSGAEKKTATHMLVQAADLRQAVKKLDEGMKGTMADYQIASVAETAIMDVYTCLSAHDDSGEARLSAHDASEAGKSIASCPDGCKTTVTIADKTVVIDKTEKHTVVTPNQKENQYDVRGNETDG